MLSRRQIVAVAPAFGLGMWAFERPASAQPGAGPTAPLIGRFQVTANRPWTQVYVEGQGPFRFLIDTGASTSIIDPALAARLNLPRLQDAQLQGATAERTVEMYVSRQVVVAETLRQRGQVVFAAGAVGADFDGVLPGAIFTAANTEIDFAAGEFRIYPSGAPDRTGFTRLPLTADAHGRQSGRLVVAVRLDGRPLNLMLDTGGAGSVLLSGEYVGKNKLWDRYAKWEPGEGQGLLTSFPLRLVRAQSLEFGPARLDRPVIHLTDPFNPPGDQGDGVIGMDVLRRFTLSTDPGGAALWVKPNGALNEPFRYNRAGLEARLDAGLCTVKRVRPGGPAARAGVLVGDGLPEIAGPRDLARFDWLLSEAPGARVDFEIERAGRRAPVSMVLEDLL